MRAAWGDVRAAAAPVLADLRRTASLRVRLVRSRDADIEAMLCVGDSGATSVSLGDAHDEPGETVPHLTEQVQDVVFEELPGTWPECPAHPDGHPLAVDVDAGRAVWVCPATRAPVSVVGDLAATGEPR